jgi:hypothetical protein
MLNAAKAPIAELEGEMKGIQSEAQAIQGDVDNLVQSGSTGTVEQYEKLNAYN